MTQPLPPLPQYDPSAPRQQHASLGYMVPQGNVRPGMITAIGIISIVIGSLSALSALGTSGQAIGMYFMGNMLRSISTTSTSTTVTTTSTSSVTVVRPAANTPSMNALSPAEVSSAMTSIQSGGTTLTPSQIAKVQAELQSASQPYITPNSGTAASSAATSTGNGDVTFIFPNGSLTLDPQGAIKSSITNPSPTFMTSFNISSGVLISLFISGIVSLVAAILLLIAGIQFLRGKLAGIRLHYWSIAFKIPAAIAVAVASGMMTIQLYNSMGTAMAGMPTNTIAIGTGAFWLAVSLAYPITLLFLLRSKMVRNYFHSVQAA